LEAKLKAEKEAQDAKEASAAKSEVRLLESENQELRQRLSELEIEALQANQSTRGGPSLETLEAKLAAAEAKAMVLESEKKTINDELEAAVAVGEDSDERVEELEAEVSRLQEAGETSAALQEEIKEQAKKLQALAVSHQGEVAVLKGDLNASKAEASKAQNALQEATNNLESHRKSLNEAKASYGEAKSEVGAVKKKERKVSEELAMTKSLLEDAKEAAAKKAVVKEQAKKPTAAAATAEQPPAAEDPSVDVDGDASSARVAELERLLAAESADKVAVEAALDTANDEIVDVEARLKTLQYDMDNLTGPRAEERYKNLEEAIEVSALKLSRVSWSILSAPLTLRVPPTPHPYIIPFVAFVPPHRIIWRQQEELEGKRKLQLALTAEKVIVSNLLREKEALTTKIETQAADQDKITAATEQALETENIRLVAELQAAQKATEEAQSKLTESEGRVNDLEADVSQAKKMLAGEEEDISEWEQKYAEAKGELESHKVREKFVGEEVTNLKTSIREKDKEFRKQEAELKFANSQKEDLEKEVKKAKSETKKANQATKEAETAQKAAETAQKQALLELKSSEKASEERLSAMEEGSKKRKEGAKAVESKVKAAEAKAKSHEAKLKSAEKSLAEEKGKAAAAAEAAATALKQDKAKARKKIDQLQASIAFDKQEQAKTGEELETAKAQLATLEKEAKKLQQVAAEATSQEALLARAEALQVKEDAESEILAAQRGRKEGEEALAKAIGEVESLREKLAGLESVSAARKDRIELLELQASGKKEKEALSGLDSATRGAQEWKRRAEEAERKLAEGSHVEAVRGELAAAKEAHNRELSDSRILSEKEGKEAAEALAAGHARVQEAEERAEEAERDRTAAIKEMREMKKQASTAAVSTPLARQHKEVVAPSPLLAGYLTPARGRQLEAELEALRSSTDKEIAEVKAAKEARVSAVRATFTDDLQKAQAHLEREVHAAKQAAKREHGEEAETLRAQLQAASDDLDAKQERLDAALDAKASNPKAEALFHELEEERAATAAAATAIARLERELEVARLAGRGREAAVGGGDSPGRGGLERRFAGVESELELEREEVRQLRAKLCEELKAKAAVQREIVDLHAQMRIIRGGGPSTPGGTWGGGASTPTVGERSPGEELALGKIREAIHAVGGVEVLEGLLLTSSAPAPGLYGSERHPMAQWAPQPGIGSTPATSRPTSRPVTPATLGGSLGAGGASLSASGSSGVRLEGMERQVKAANDKRVEATALLEDAVRAAVDAHGQTLQKEHESTTLRQQVLSAQEHLHKMRHTNQVRALPPHATLPLSRGLPSVAAECRC